MHLRFAHFLVSCLAFAGSLPIFAQSPTKLPQRSPLLRTNVLRIPFAATQGLRRPAAAVRTLPAPSPAESKPRPMSAAPRPLQKPVLRQLLGAAAGTELWANVISDQYKGIYAFSPASEVHFSKLAAYSKASFNGGAAIVDGRMHGIFYDLSYADMGIIMVYHYAFDIETWALDIPPHQLDDISLIAQETATDPKTGEVFGAFLRKDGTSYEWGVIDYLTLTRTSIAPVEHIYIALGIDKDGKAYGVATDGNLYAIDRTNGKETLVGPTGVSLADADGKVRSQCGEIDPKDNTFYWASTNGERHTDLYKVSLDNGQATLLGSIGNEVTVTGMVVPKPKAADDAPSAATDLHAQFAAAATAGQLSFTAPTKTYGGSALSGELTYHVYVNTDAPLTGKVNAGSSAVVPVQAREGMNTFVVTLSNAAGASPKARLSAYAGYDTPKSVDKLTLSVDAARRADLTWTAPTATQHGGFLGTLTYDLIRITGTDTTQVANGISDVHFAEVLPEGPLMGYRYAVRAHNQSQVTTWTNSNNAVVGSPIEPPFFDEFANAADAELYTVIDNNNDQASWAWDKDPYTEQTAYRYHWSDTENADDWLLLPPLRLRAGKVYTFQFKAKSNGTDYTERFEVKWGQAPNPAGLSTVILNPTEVSTDEYQTFTNELRPQADGTYYIGFHALSDAGGYYLHIDSVSIAAPVAAAAPAAAENLKGKADPSGKLLTTLTFDAPKQKVDGTALSNIERIEVRNGIRLVKAFTQPAPGASLTATDNRATTGDNVYTVIAFNADGAGATANKTIYVGQDQPATPVIAAEDLSNAVRLTWPAVGGANGGLVIPEEVTYNIYNVRDGGYRGDLIATVTGGKTEYVVPDQKTAEGNQRYAQWAISAKNKAGESGYGVGSIIVGKPYTLPFHNSFKGSSTEGQLIALETPDGNVAWEISGKEAVDADGGSIVFNPDRAGSSVISTGKISLQGAAHPKLIFDHKQIGQVQGRLEISIRKKNQKGETLLRSFDYAQAGVSKAEWHTEEIDIPQEYLQEEYVFVRFAAIATASMKETPLYVDNINLAEPVAKDAEITLAAPKSVLKGQNLPLSLKVANKGLQDLTKVQVKVKINGKQVYDKAVEGGLARFKEATIPVNYRTTSLDAATTLSVVAEVVADGDALAANNEARAEVQAVQGNVPTPRDLVLKYKDAAKVELDWAAPTVEYVTLTDDFEAYEPWATSFGRWSTIDADKGYACPLSKESRYPHQQEQFAFMNWQPGDLYGSGQGLDPHSGTKALVAVYQTDQTGKTYVKADNWLISPPLSGKAQKIRFYVNNYAGKDFGNEEFEVLVSSTDKAQESFQLIGDIYTQTGGSWTEINVDLPEGTNYFAIRHTTSADQAFLFMIDDITYEGGNTPTGYRVYCDGQYLGAAEQPGYTDTQAKADGQHTYSVTAVYADTSESLPVVLDVVTALIAPNASPAHTPIVYDVHGKRVDAARSQLPRGVYVIDGKKVVIK